MPEKSHDVVIAGAGIAASATSLRLSSLGLRPLILTRVCKPSPGVEAIPLAALRLFAELEITSALSDAGATSIHNFENHWDPESPSAHHGNWICVERERLAAAVLRKAIRCGASIRVCEKLPELWQDQKSVQFKIDGISHSFEAAIDATGRAATWSRPILRRGNQIADVYDVASSGDAAPAKIVRRSDSWAYLIQNSDHASMAILSSGGRKRQIPDAFIERSFCISQGSFRYIGRRPAFVQWSEAPVRGRRIAVGDAALAYDPLAGQGIRFALSSAITAGSVIRTWRQEKSCSNPAAEFYSDFVARSCKSHLRFVELWQKRPRASTTKQLTIVPDIVKFSDRIVKTALLIDGIIRADLAFDLTDGNHARWFGDVDLMELRASIRTNFRSADLVAKLMVSSCDRTQAVALVNWCVQHRVLLPAP